jgi:hypothetical protein
MNTYTVTASNAYFWQKLAVQARTPKSAVRKFAAYLSSRESRANEKYEWNQGKKLSPDERCDRAAYYYDFHTDKVEALDCTDQHRVGHVGVIVSMIDSGGNG